MTHKINECVLIRIRRLAKTYLRKKNIKISEKKAQHICILLNY